MGNKDKKIPISNQETKPVLSGATSNTIKIPFQDGRLNESVKNNQPVSQPKSGQTNKK